MAKTNIFHLTTDHLKLLQAAYVDWDDCEFGSPAIDCKRPYGNSSVYQDMLDILGLKEVKPGIFTIKIGGRSWVLKGEDKNDIYLDGADERQLLDVLNELHRQTATALQICLSTQQFKPGLYRESDCGKWQAAGGSDV